MNCIFVVPTMTSMSTHFTVEGLNYLRMNVIYCADIQSSHKLLWGSTYA